MSPFMNQQDQNNYPNYPNYPQQGSGQTPDYNQPQQPAYPQYPQPQTPGYDQPAYAQPQTPAYPDPNYGQYGQPTPGYDQPAYGQPQAPAYPDSGYGQYGQPSPAYGQQPYGYGYMPPAPKRNVGVWIAGGVGALLVLCLLIGALGHSFGGGGSTNGSNVIYHDSLTDNPAGWTPVNTQCAAKSDGLHIASGGLCVAPAGTSLNNVTISVTSRAVAATSTTAYGLVFRLSQNPTAFYAFEISPAGAWVFYKFANGHSAPIQGPSPSPAISTGLGASNTLKVTANGSNFSLFVNGTQVGQGSDSSFSVGAVALDLDAQSSEVVYTNFEVDRA